jgi:uncharacterized protein
LFDLYPIAATATAACAVYACASLMLGHRFTTPRDRQRVAADLSERLPRHEPVRLKSRDGRDLAGWYVPADQPKGAVILVHGMGAHKGFELEADPLCLVSDLIQARFAVLAIDLRGHGESAPSRMSYGFHERLDVLGAVDWLIDRGHAPGKIGVLGASMGGAAAIAAAAEERAIGAVATDCAFADFGAVLERQFPRVLPFGLGRVLLPGTLLAARILVGTFMHRFAPARLANALADRHVLVIHSDADPFIPRWHGHAIATAAGAQLWETQCDRHVGSFAADTTAYRRRVREFFDSALTMSAK